MNNNSKDYAAHLWDRAEECRAVAAIIQDPDLRADYLKLAEVYLGLAAKEEKLRDRPAEGN